MATIERRSWPLAELRVDGEGAERKVTWYASVFDSLSEDMWGVKERVGRRAFTKTLQEADIRALFNHDPSFVLGRNKAGTLDLKVDLAGLRSTVTPPDTQWARDLMVSVERGDVTAGSFGFQVISDKWSEEDGQIIRTLNEVKLFDVSLVTYPAYPGTDGSAAFRSLLEAADVNPTDLIESLARARAGSPPSSEQRARFDEAIAKLRAQMPAPVIDHAPAIAARKRTLELLARRN